MELVKEYSNMIDEEGVTFDIKKFVDKFISDHKDNVDTNRIYVGGYSMGGKTGTAEKLPRGNKKYVVSFLGFAPYENPELVIYCTVDEPNSKNQAYSRQALQAIFRLWRQA